MVRLLPEQAAEVDKWRKAQSDEPGRPEAIRRLIEIALAVKVNKKQRRDDN
jgi:hypothetical protein